MMDSERESGTSNEENSEEFEVNPLNDFDELLSEMGNGEGGEEDDKKKDGSLVGSGTSLQKTFE